MSGTSAGSVYELPLVDGMNPPMVFHYLLEFLLKNCLTARRIDPKMLDNPYASKVNENPEELQRELLAAYAKLEQQEKQEHRLLEEIRKYNPQFRL
ncbi:unnamed protein product [Ranitomeya imitator]|uniref:Uncharacterized protein n=1 Tax=Ranitomeya imitator TaxID=111125 RepID=A0ABN9MKL6_9NEOB|nr:unnamed protein product [Ranitomeya imitator]